MLASRGSDEIGISIFGHEFLALWEEEASESNAKPHFNRGLLRYSCVPHCFVARSECYILTGPRTGSGSEQFLSIPFSPLNTNFTQTQKLNFWIERGGVLQVQSMRGLKHPDSPCQG